ncbi:MAG: hypothetical protein R3F56_15335 [Planctomycetota bacterium]
MDLRRNPEFYQPTGYSASAPGDRDVFVAPVVDERKPPQDEGQLPTLFLSDRDWERPVPVMVHEILRDELRDSGVFRQVLDAASPEALLVKPVLRSFEGGVQEQLYGRRSLAAVGLQVEVYGPLQDNERKLLLTQPLFERPVSSPGFKPASPRVLLGAALQATMTRLVGAIDASNVGRSAVVTDADLRKQ